MSTLIVLFSNKTPQSWLVNHETNFGSVNGSPRSSDKADTTDTGSAQFHGLKWELSPGVGPPGGE